MVWGPVAWIPRIPLWNWLFRKGYPNWNNLHQFPGSWFKKWNKTNWTKQTSNKQNHLEFRVSIWNFNKKNIIVFEFQSNQEKNHDTQIAKLNLFQMIKGYFGLPWYSYYVCYLIYASWPLYLVKNSEGSLSSEGPKPSTGNKSFDFKFGGVKQNYFKNK